MPPTLSFRMRLWLDLGYLRVAPRSVTADQLCRLVRPPASRIIRVKRRHVVENGLHDPPLGVHDVLASEQVTVAVHRVTEQPLVVRPVGGGLSGQHQFHVVARSEEHTYE